MSPIIPSGHRECQQGDASRVPGSRLPTIERETVSGYAVRSTEDDESAGGYFVTGTMKDLVPTW